MDQVTATDFARNLSDFLNRVRYRDESLAWSAWSDPKQVTVTTCP